MKADQDLDSPDWMPANGGSGCACMRSGRRRKDSVVERTLEGLSEALRSSIFSERVAARRGFLQLTDPRVKTACLLVLLVVTAVVHNAAILDRKSVV